ncbi:hypothetical protein HZS_1281 [Henneguya salminicola]|nr:hypothetical protein HZS_1281 [Henneguya salminicola]
MLFGMVAGQYVPIIIHPLSEKINASISNKKIIQIYGQPVNEPIMLKIGKNYCPEANRYKIVTSSNILNADIYIMNIDKYSSFIKKYSRMMPIDTKKILLLYVKGSPFSVVNQGFEYEKSKGKFYHWVSSFYHTSFFRIPFGYYQDARNKKKIDSKVQEGFLYRKSAALAIVSNCNSANSIRDKYIAELSKNFPVDLFGKCYNNYIDKRERAIKLNEYKFYLSFENVHCDEYITEKYWDTVQYGTIPIILGTEKYLKGILKNSYINVFDFQSPKQLSEYLNFVSSNKTEYFKYHLWRKYYSAYNYIPDSCKLLNKITKSLKSKMLDDPTINKIADTSICLPSKAVEDKILQRASNIWEYTTEGFS